MREQKTNHILMYLACEQLVFGVQQFQRRSGLNNLRENGAQGLDNT